MKPCLPQDELRIVSLLPSATEMVYALGLESYLLAVSHGCDFPPAASQKPIVVNSSLSSDALSLGEIDSEVSEKLRQGESLYLLDVAKIAELRPTLILTQDLCQVCAPAGNEVSKMLEGLPTRPEVLFMSPHLLGDIERDLLSLGEQTGTLREARLLIEGWHRRLQKLRPPSRDSVSVPTVFCVEWTDPPYCAGHWVPEMLELAGGRDPLGQKGKNSIRVSWDQIAQADPEFIIILPCGFGLADSIQQARSFVSRPEVQRVQAVRKKQVFAVDAGYFSRPGPRVIDGAELLAHILRPDAVAWLGSKEAFARI